MAWYDDIPQSAITKVVTPNKAPVPTDIKVQSMEQPYSNTIKDYNPNIDPGSLDKVNTDLSNSITGINNTGSATINKDNLGAISSLRGDNKYTPYLDKSLTNLQDYASGNSKVDQTASNIALSRLDASMASANLSQAQKIASNPYLTQGAKQTASAEMLRTANAERATTAGNLALEAQKRAYDANSKMADVAQVAVNFEEGKFEYDTNKAGEALSRDLQAKIASGQLTATQVSAELDKAKAQIDVASQIKQREFDKLKIIASNDLEKEKIDLDKAKYQQELYSYWMGNTANTVMSMWDKNPDLSSNDIINDPAAMKSFTLAYQNMPGNEGKIPNEDEISTMMLGMKPEWKIASETYDRNWNDTEQALISSGASQPTIDYFRDFSKLTSASGGTVSVSPDGSISIVGADGEPFTYTDEYGKEQSMSFNSNSSNDGSKLISTLESTLSRKQVNEFIDNVLTGKSVGEKEFINMVRDSLPNKQNIISDTELIKLHSDIVNKKLTTSKIETEKETFNESTPWTKENISILEDPKNENFSKALKAVVTDVVDGYGTNNLNELIKTNPKVYDNIVNIAKNKTITGSAKEISSMKSGDLYYNKTNKSIYIKTDRVDTNGNPISINLTTAIQETIKKVDTVKQTVQPSVVKEVQIKPKTPAIQTVPGRF